MKYTCLSVRQPWAWLILQGYKDLENRSQQCHKRGTIALHASTTNTKKEYAAALALIANRGLNITLPAIEELVTGAIVGLVDIVDCVTESDSPWFTGEHGWVLANPRPGTPYQQKGQQGFFSVDYQFQPLKKAPDYGKCHRCQGAIVIPGLDQYKCGNCGWQYHLNELARMQREQDNRTRQRETRQTKAGAISINHHQN